MQQTVLRVLWEKIIVKAFPRMLTVMLGLALFTSTFLIADSAKCKESRRCKDSKRFKKPHATVGQPVQVNTAIDFEFQNSATVFSNLFPTFVPSLPSFVGQMNSAFSSEISVNPQDPNHLIVLYDQDAYFDNGGLYSPFPITSVAAFSFDGGKTWGYSFPLVPSWLPSRPSQVTGQILIRNSSGNGSNIAYLSDGTVIYSGLFQQTDPGFQAPFPSPSLGAKGGMVVAKSFTKGATWTDPVIVDTTESGAFCPGISSTATSVDFMGYGSILATPPSGQNCSGELVHLSWSRSNLVLGNLFSDVWYSRSIDRGDTWTAPVAIYNLLNDPVWVENHFNAHFPLGGNALGAKLVSVKTKKRNVLLAGILRLYPTPDATSLNLNLAQDPNNAITDHVVIRSLDQGKTWNPVAKVVSQFVLGHSHNPTVTPLTAATMDGDFNNTMIVSPKTKRVYYAWQAGNPKIDPDPQVYQYYPEIQLSVSSNAGCTWSGVIVVSRTPLNLEVLGANQAFNVSLACTKDGILGVTYQDFRYYDGGPIVAANTWLALYKELNDAGAGPNGNGLQFIGEYSLTPSTFNASIALNSILGGIAQNTSIAAQGKNFVTTFTTTNQGNLPQETGPFGMTLDFNNRTNVHFEKIGISKK